MWPLLAAALCATAGGAVVLEAEPHSRFASPPIIYVVRHAERAADTPLPDTTRPLAKMNAKDPELSAEGHTRARRLASMLRDAGITRIFATEYRRTQQTAAPLASLAEVAVETAAAQDVGSLVDRVIVQSAPVLIVGHSNTVPDILRALGVRAAITVADDEYDNLFVVVRSDGSPVLVRLRY